MYCSGCEEFVTEEVAKANNGICPHHEKPYEKLAEENYFFKLSAFGPKVQTMIEKDEFLVIPETRKNEILHVFKQGLQDISISRPKDKLEWGIPVPGDIIGWLGKFSTCDMLVVHFLSQPRRSCCVKIDRDEPSCATNERT